MLNNAKWIRKSDGVKAPCPVFKKNWEIDKEIVRAELAMTVMGVYQVKVNGQAIDDQVLAPGWTVYEERLQVQSYDITQFLKQDNEIRITAGPGWYSSPMPGWYEYESKIRRAARPIGVIAEIVIDYVDGSQDLIHTDEDWLVSSSPVLFSEIYDGETYDARIIPEGWQAVELFDGPSDTLIPHEGMSIKEKERITPREIIRTPKGELVIDFGQEVTGYIELNIEASAGERIEISHAEVLDKAGNFYNENYRNAKSKIIYICKDGQQTWKPALTFFGFRYIRLDQFPFEPKLEHFTAIAVYSDIKQTGRIKTSNAKLNQFISNVFWGQKGNFLDVPTDCPQRDERLGWTGDAAAFIKTASYNFDVKQFFYKWLRDMQADQLDNGRIPDVVPDFIQDGHYSAAWGDAATIVPWQIYQTYGDVQVLEDNFNMMCKWVDFITSDTTDEYLWKMQESQNRFHYGDWLGLDAEVGSYRGLSNTLFIASVYYAHSTNIVIKSGKLLGRNVSKYEQLLENIRKKIKATFSEFNTQTECILALMYDLTDDKETVGKRLVELIENNDFAIQTGFVGTPLILHALSNIGRSDIAYKLLLRDAYPSWLFSVRMGATTIWEHLDGVNEDGDFWSADMNSFNHYAYGAVLDWVYEQAAGIQPASPGFETVRIAPQVTPSLEWIEAELETRHGLVKSAWNWQEGKVRYTIETPVHAEVIIGETTYQLEPGSYILW